MKDEKKQEIDSMYETFKLACDVFVETVEKQNSLIKDLQKKYCFTLIGAVAIIFMAIVMIFAITP